MIIKVHKKEDNKFLRIFISVMIILSIFSYYIYHITYKTHEDNKAFEVRVENISKEKKEARKLQRSILDESDKIIATVGANYIESIKFDNKYLNITINNDKVIDSILARYEKMVKIKKSNNTWIAKIDIQMLLELKRAIK